ncbi:MAG: winged helix-turn-helix transcriptional regulator, partial [Myxococcota bacterium]
MSDLDKADRILLDAVQENCRVGLEVLSEKSALSPPSVQRRLKRMRDQGIIEREIA